jgi:hypothetical protein
MLIEKYRSKLESRGRELAILKEATTRFYPALPDGKLLTEENIARHEFVLLLVLAEPNSTAATDAAIAEGGRQ